MKKKILSALLALSMVSFTAVYAEGDSSVSVDEFIGNMLSNGTFESGLSGWTADEGTEISQVTDGAFYSSAKAMKISGGTVNAKLSNIYQQEAYKVEMKAKACTGEATITLKYNPSNKGDITILTKTISASDGWVEISDVFKWQNETTYSYKGAKLTTLLCGISVDVSSACLIDEVIVKPSDEKIINADENSMGNWISRIVSGNDGNMTYNANEGALYVEKTQKINSTALQPIALENGYVYKLTADVKAANDVGKILLYFGGSADSREIILNSEGWTHVEEEFENTYNAEGELAGTFVAFSGLSAAVTADLYIKNVSVKKVTGTEAVLPEATVTLPEAATAQEAITPTVTTEATGLRYKYLYNDNVVDYGFVTDGDLPAYTPEYSGTFEVLVTPVNEYGYGQEALASLSVEGRAVENSGVEDIDSAMGNYLNNGTFDTGLPSGWKYDGLSSERDIVNASDGSAASMKLTGSGTITIENLPLYCNEVYDAMFKIKSASDSPVTASVTVNMASKEQEIGSITADSGQWSEFSEQFARYYTTYKNVEAKAAPATVTITIDRDCYIDDFIIKVADEMFVTENGVRIMAENEITEVGGWIQRGTNCTLEYSDGVLTGTSFIQSNDAAAQNTVLRKGESYTFKADVKKAETSASTKCKINVMYTAVVKNIELTDEWQTVEVEIPSDKVDELGLDVIGSSVIVGSANGTNIVDMHIKNASLRRNVEDVDIPQLQNVKIPATVVTGGVVSPAEIAADFERVPAMGFRYIYKLDGVPVSAGYASNENLIPAYNIPADAEGGSVITLTVIPVNSQGENGTAVVSDSCSIIKAFEIVNKAINGTISAGATITADVSVKNYTDEASDISVIIAYYENNILYKCAAEQKNVSSGDKVQFTPSFVIPADLQGNGDVKLYVWRDNGNGYTMQPVLPMTQF